MATEDQDYVAAGFDNFLSRSIDNNPQNNLDSPSPPNNAVAFDRTQATGSLGDSFRIGGTQGSISFNGSEGNIIGNDGQNDFFILGQDGT